MRVISRLVEDSLSSEEGLCCMEFVRLLLVYLRSVVNFVVVEL